MRDAVAATYRGRINLVTVAPEQTVAEQDADARPGPVREQPRPVLRPAQGRAAGPGAAPATTPGPPACAATSRSPGRATQVVDWDRRNGKVKVNPIARWTQADVDAYIERHGVLANPLLSDGYASVGCFPCTRRTGAGEDARAGRWAGKGKTECGIHLVGAPA